MTALAFALAQLTISVNQTVVRSDVAPLVERGRVLLPVRAVFEALGAAVDFDAPKQRIDLRRGRTFVQLQIGAPQALVGARRVALDVPPRVFHARTFIPIRFVAESFGATVDYDRGTRTVAILDPNAPGTVAAAAQTSRAAESAAQGYEPPTVVNRHPAPDEVVNGGFPAISAAVTTHGGAPVDPASVRMFLDGRDVTDRTFEAGDEIGYTPTMELANGTHEVTVQGADQSGARFTANWEFRSAYTPPAGPAYPTSGFAGYPGYGAYPISMSLNGPYAYGWGNVLSLILAGPPGGNGYVSLCGYGPQYPFVPGPDPFHYYATIPIPTNVFAPSCYVSGTFFDPSGFHEFLSLGQPLQINTVTPSPGATPVPIARHPVPTPAPHATPSPSPSQRRLLAHPVPQHTPAAAPKSNTPVPQPPRPPTPRHS